MEFFNKKEKNISKKFKSNGFIISKTESYKSLSYIKSKIIKVIKKKLRTNLNINLNHFHKIITADELNDIRIYIINNLNADKTIRYHYFNIAKEKLFCLVGNELMMQKNINLSIQFPEDTSSLLPVHSDVWSGDSPYEINLWIPLVDCYKTKSMFILKPKDYENVLKKKIISKAKNTGEIFKSINKKVKFIKIKHGKFLIFNQNLPHGNVINKENETRWSLNCRFKSFFSPYGDKKIGEFFLPITPKPMTELGLNYKNPF